MNPMIKNNSGIFRRFCHHCDYYKFNKKDAEVMNTYKGEYMSQYEWAAYNKKYLNDIHKRWKKENK